MIRSMYDAAASMMAQLARQLTISDNLANQSTPGYKAKTLRVEDFKDMMLSRITGDTSTQVGSLSTGVRPDQSDIDMSQGSLLETGNPLDLAIAGTAFFAVQTPGGVQYTRDGTFHLDASGKLVTQDGMAVLGLKGPLALPQGPVVVAADGTVSVNGTAIDQLQLVEFPTGTAATAVGNSRYTLAGPGTQSTTAGVSQGFLEQSNVDLNQTVVDMMAAGRSYSLAQRMLQLSDSSLQLAVDEIGKVVS